MNSEIPKAFTKRVCSGEITNFTGISSPYEECPEEFQLAARPDALVEQIMSGLKARRILFSE